MEHQVKVAAVQLATKIADSSANLTHCERLAQRAVEEGARWIALPEFFSTGVAWEPKIADEIESETGAAASLLRDFSARHGVVIGGSFLCRIETGAVRNRYLAFANGTLVGRHDKDIPTMWENAFYEGGDTGDSGILGSHEDVRIGAALCWEFMRTMTARRLRGNVDVIMGGSCWWSIPELVPGFIKASWEKQNLLNSIGCIQDTARLVGAPVIHAAHCGSIDCRFLGLPPLTYRGHFEGNAAIVNASGQVLAIRGNDDGEGVVYAEIPLGNMPVEDEIPGHFWLRARGILPVIAWHYHRLLGSFWYKRHVRQVRP